MIILPVDGQVSLKAHAKINLTLEIGKRREDGFHDISSVVQEIALHDVIKIRKSEENGEITVGSDSGITPIGRENIAFRAASTFMKYVGLNCGLDIFIGKNIPVCAGLGGGSSDAASVLLGLRELFNIDVPDEILSKLSSQIGSDVPFFICGGTAVVGGRGEKITKTVTLPKIELILIKPDFGISTKDAYLAWDEQDMPSSEESKALKLVSMLTNTETCCLEEMLKGRLYNDFEQVIRGIYPKVSELKEEIRAAGAFEVQMAGSGPTVFGMFSDTNSADMAAEKLKSGFPKYDVIRTHTLGDNVEED